MKDLLVKVDQKGKDWAEVDVYVKTSKRGFHLKTLGIWADNGEVKTRWRKREHDGFLCLHCKKAELSDIASGHIIIEKPDKGLCSTCANTEAIFNKYVDYDEKGEYKLKQP